MKQILVLFGLIIVLSSYAPWETITGNGVIKKESRAAGGYSGISTQGSMNVQLAYGNSNTVTVEADENLLPYIETAVENDKLIIRTKKGYNLKSKSKMLVYASLTRLTSLTVSGSGNVTGEGAFSNNGKTDISVSGSGDIKLGADAFNELKVSVSGSGNVNLKGNSCNNISASISGSGNIDCGSLKTNDVFARISGSGNVKVNASKTIDAKVSGSGNVINRGSASNTNIKTSGAGRLVSA
jgi:hypothetical protein